MKRAEPTSRYLAGVASVLISLFCLSAFQTRTALAAGAVEMQVERMVIIAIGEYNDAMEAGEPGGWLKYFTDDVRRQSPQSAQQGKQEFSGYYRSEFENYRARWNTRKMIISGRSAAVVFEWDAVHKPTGNPLKVDMVAVFELASSGKFESVGFYFDTASLGQYAAKGGSEPK
jgi:hypothetical protein